MRTREELQGAILGLQKARQSADVQLWLREAKEFKDSLLASGYMAAGEEAVRVLGVQQGIDLVMQLDKVLVTCNNIGNKPNLIKP